MPDPNNILLPRHGLAFFGLCKNANTAIKRAFLESLDYEFRPRDRGSVHRPWQFRYANAGEIKFSGLWSFAVVRDPYDRIASCWRDKMHQGWNRKGHDIGLSPGMAFGDFVRVVATLPDRRCTGWFQHWRGQASDLQYDDGSLVPDFIGRYEALDAAWNAVRRKSRLPLPELKRENASTPRPVPWTPALRATVRDRYREDFERFGYAA